MINCQTNLLNKYLQINSSFECIIPSCQGLTYEVNQVECLDKVTSHVSRYHCLFSWPNLDINNDSQNIRLITK